MNEETIPLPKSHHKHFPVAAIGASAGGLEAISQMLYHLPDKTGIAYVYIQHLDPSYESNLTTILQRETKMPVLEAVDKIKVETDHLYVIPPNKEMALVDGIISVTDRPTAPYANLPINRFFISLAERYKEYAIGIVLSGTASDGTLGLKAIKMEGGVTFAQDDSAKFQSMPRSAASEGGVDLVMSPKQIAEELTKIGKQKDYYYSILGNDGKPAEVKEKDEEADFVNILHLVQKSVGVDFSQYKMTTIKRRIVRRMMIYKSASVKDYLQYIKQHTREVELLYHDLLINVTAFFRDAESSAFLQKTILPKIIKGKSVHDPIRVWVPACSTGQEAYSLAMLIVEELGDESANTPVQLFATDLSESVINKARIGVYTQDEVSEIPPKRLQRFFTKTDGHYRIVKSIRDLCIFATHNIAKDPPFSRLDIISCCNLLIYLDNNLQRRLMSTFHYSLNNEGYLILGKSETIGASTSLFSQLDKKYKIYNKRKDTTAKATFDMTFRTDSDRALLVPHRSSILKAKADDVDLEKIVDGVLLTRYSPASVIVTADLDIVQFRGSTGLYLEASPGRASLNLMKMARQGLAFELRNIVHKAKKTGESVKKSGLHIKSEDKTLEVSIEAMPIKSETDEEYFLVIFEQTEREPEINYGSIKDERVKQLEGELAALREDMRSIVESQEAANEELQSANEEIVSSNEELQSINEELETSKEEIESSNEELTTINQELQVRNEELAEAHEYAQAVYDTIREAVLVMDKGLRIKTANNCFFKLFNTNEYETIGMFFNELGNKQWDLSPLKSLLEQVIERDTHFKDYEVNTFFPGIGQKIMLLNAKKVHQKIHGAELVLLAIEDVTNFRQAQKVLAEQEKWFKHMANNAPVAIWVTGLDRTVNFMNDTGLKYRGMTLQEIVGKEWSDGAHPDDIDYCERIYHDSFSKKSPFEIRYRLQKHDKQYMPMVSIGKPNYDSDGAFIGFIGTCTELSDSPAV